METIVLPPARAPTSVTSSPAPGRSSAVRRLWVGISSAGAVVLGVAPRALHHVGLFAGALFAGVGGSLVFGAIGFLASVPFLLRVHRRTGTWRMPMVLLALFAVVFSISTFVIGPAITNGPIEEKPPASSGQTTPATPGPNQKDKHGHEPKDGRDSGNSMMGGSGDGWSGSIALVILLGVLATGLAILAASRSRRQSSPQTPGDILSDRDARGDIDTADYEERRIALGGGLT